MSDFENEGGGGGLQIPMASNPALRQYVFPAYWGGMVMAQVPPQIHDKLTELRRAVGSLAAKKQQGGPMFPVRSAKELMQKLAEALDELGMHAFPISQEVTHFETDKIPSNSTSSGKPVFRTLAHVKSTVRVGASDGSYVDVVGSGHGGDVDDKAGGKADTYAWKSALLKGLCVPEQDMPDTDDEAPSDERPASPKNARQAAPPTASGKTEKVLPNVPTAPEQKATLAQADANIDETIKLINRMSSDELDVLGNEIRSGKYNFSTPQKLKLSAAFVKRRDQLKAGNAAKSEQPTPAN